MISKYWFYFWPIVGFMLITPFTPYLDLAMAHSFYTPAKGFESNQLFDFFYRYGFMPADVVAIGALLLFLLGCFASPCKKLRAPMLVLSLSLLLGSGVIVHVLLKDNWGRPRPRQVVDFGGTQPFRPYYQPNFHQKEPAKSFPCGHCSTGFYFFALALVGWREKSKWLVWTGLILALGLGIMLSLVRMAQGGHFFSDVLASALIMWLTACWCTRYVYSRLDLL